MTWVIVQTYRPVIVQSSSGSRIVAWDQSRRTVSFVPSQPPITEVGELDLSIPGNRAQAGL